MGESESDELDDIEDPRITEVESEEEVPKLVTAGKKANKKRAAEEDDATLDDLMSKANGDDKASKKAAKKLKKNDGQAVAGAAEPAKKADKAADASADKKKVQFAKNLELGPTGSPKVEAPKAEAKKEAAKGPRNVSGVTVDDKKEGKGKAAKKGDRVEMRYIGKLKNGKVFDCEYLYRFLREQKLTICSQQEGQAILLQAWRRPGYQGLGRRCRRHDPWR
jgi:FK506-binding nuclear protein